MKHPIQPIDLVDGVARFSENKITCWIVRHLTGHRGGGTPRRRSTFHAKAIWLTVSGPSPQCTDPQYPLSVEFHNRTDQRVTAMSFNIVGRRPGYSGKVIDTYWNWDKTIDPRSGWSGCWRDHKYDYEAGKTAGLNWTAEVSSSTFE